MPPVRSARNRKPPPDGFDDIEDTLLEFANKMKDAENASHEGKKRQEVLWPVFQISHQRMSFPYVGGLVTYRLFEIRLQIYLRFILRQRSHLQAALRVATQKWLRGREPDCQVEEARLRKSTCFWNVSVSH